MQEGRRRLRLCYVDVLVENQVDSQLVVATRLEHIIDTFA